MMRLVSLADADPAVKGESIEDTVADVHNYVDYYLAFKREKWVTRSESKMHNE